MGGLTKGIFGGEQKATQNQSSQQTQNMMQNQSHQGTSSYAPWEVQIPYILDAFKRLQSNLNARPAGQDLNVDAANSLRKTISGDYLYGNPESKKAIDAITTDTMNRVMPGLDTKFAASGRYGSGLHKQALGQSIADTSAAAMARNYASERSNQIGATGMAPSIAGALDWETNRLMQLLPFIFQNLGGSSTSSGTSKGTSSGTSTGTSTGTTTQDMYRNPLSGAAGGALIGGKAFGPWGAGVGGLLGLLGI